MKIIALIITALCSIIGFSSTFYLVVSLFWTIAQKIFRKLKYHASLYD
ncbi:MAG: hypothetical protein HFI40_11230 [Lachnospiraceae bacterium]|nr:hypothetical protein [Lachnospiraceae bacterium]MCX4317898.1 hypothetical protein [Lachnospiraceae bacterium]